MQGLDGLAKLFVAVVLQEEMDLRAVVVALGTILGIVMEPVFVLLDELLEISGVFQRFPLLLESGLEMLPFGSLLISRRVPFIDMYFCTVV